MIHAHYGSESRDCDGSYNHGSDIAALDKDGNELDEYQFIERMLRFLFHDPSEGEFELRAFYDEAGHLVIDAAMPTDEGFWHGGVVICEDDDFEPEYNGFRDHTAESMGY